MDESTAAVQIDAVWHYLQQGYLHVTPEPSRHSSLLSRFQQTDYCLRIADRMCDARFLLSANTLPSESPPSEPSILTLSLYSSMQLAYPHAKTIEIALYQSHLRGSLIIPHIQYFQALLPPHNALQTSTVKIIWSPGCCEWTLKLTRPYWKVQLNTKRFCCWLKWAWKERALRNKMQAKREREKRKLKDYLKKERRINTQWATRCRHTGELNERSERSISVVTQKLLVRQQKHTRKRNMHGK